ncbi:MAG TPA: metalloregulator ArsR/SmtB family transcription factor [Gemmatimonadaceae bacterium]|nr:metalloregulator ArsR/SmtB family transcription factor [Gemmatimonadaceae bacterium]
MPGTVRSRASRLPSRLTDRVFNALADPTRRELLELLRDGTKPVHELADAFRITRPAVSQHLRVLRDARLVRETRVGRERHYRLQGAALREVAEWIARYERFWTEGFDRLGPVLDELQRSER